MHRVQTSVNQRKRDTESQSDRWSAGNIGTQCQWKQQFRAKCVSLIQSTECCFRVQGLTHTHTHTKWAQKECKKTRSREMHHTDSLTLHLAIAPVETIYPFWNTKYLLLLSQNDVFGWKIGVNCLQSLPLLCSLSLVSILFLSLNCHGFLCL